MRHVLAALAVLAGVPAAAQQFAAGSEAAEWGLLGEEKARFAATVVDPLCTIAGDCPADCGAGARQLGLLRKADGVLVLAIKNSQPLFTGAATDLAPWCGKEVEVDGLLVGDPDQTKAKFYQVQTIRAAGATDWAKTERFTEVWAKDNPTEAATGEPWFRVDPRVQAHLREKGYLGLGLETDAAYIKEIFPQ